MFQLGGGKALHDTLRSLMEMQKVDIVFYTSKNGKIRDSVVNDPLISVPAFAAAATPALKLAALGGEKADTVRVGERVYDVVAIPALDADHQQIGVLALGSELGSAAAHEFSRLTQGQVALLADGHIIASTLPGLEASAQFVKLFKTAGTATNVIDAAVNVKPVVLAGVHYYCTAGRFESLSGDDTLGYILLSSHEQSLNEKHATQWLLLAVSFLAILAGGWVVWYFRQPGRRSRCASCATARKRWGAAISPGG